MGLRSISTTSASLRHEPPTRERPIWVLNGREQMATTVLPHRHIDRAQLLVPTKGVVRVMSNNAVWIVPPAKGILVPVDFEHSMSAPAGSELLTVNIHPSLLPSQQNTCRVVQIDTLTSALLDALGRHPRNYPLDSPASRVADVLVDKIRSAKGEAYGLSRPTDPRARGIADALMKDPANSLTLPEWGARFGASERTLARIFRAETGMGFRDYRRQVQMHAAVGLLIEGASITDTAAELGYESTPAFIHAFRITIGVTPGRFRDQER